MKRGVLNPKFHASQRSVGMLSPVIPEVASWIRASPGTVSMGQGVAFFPPPDEVKTAAIAAMDDPKVHGYSLCFGNDELLTLIREKLQQDNGITCDEPGSLIVTAGANMAFCHAIHAIADPGDEIILPSPYYFNHHMAITMAGMKPVTVPTDRDYQLNLDALKAAINRRTKAIVSVSPNNPTGAVYPRTSLQQLNNLCREAGIFHISDEAYEYFCWDPVGHFSPGSIKDADQHTISIFSLSKSYGFAGWRIGYMTVPASLRSSLRKIQDTQLISPPGITQHAASGALRRGRSWPEKFHDHILRARDMVHNTFLNHREICTPSTPDGAFYIMTRFNVPDPPETLVKAMISHHRIGALPGTTFGTDQCCIRFSYGALDSNTLNIALPRLENFLRSLQGQSLKI